MFIQEQMATLAEMNDEMQDVLTEMTAQISPITSVYDKFSTAADFALQISQWYDLIGFYIFV